MFDWQSILVFLAVSAAVIYVSKRALKRFYAFFTSSGNNCNTGCGKCGIENASSKMVSLKRR